MTRPDANVGESYFHFEKKKVDKTTCSIQDKRDKANMATFEPQETRTAHPGTMLRTLDHHL
jgi:hypothetical protein